MFSREVYEKLKKSTEFKKFSRNCYLGFLSTYIISIIIITLITFSLCPVNFIPDNCVLYLLACYIFAALMIVLIIYLNLNKRVPYLCAVGTITEKSEKFAEVELNGVKFKGTSFERFLKNERLTNYNIGDKVIIYSASKKAARPLFYHAN